MHKHTKSKKSLHLSTQTIRELDQKDLLLPGGGYACTQIISGCIRTPSCPM